VLISIFPRLSHLDVTAGEGQIVVQREDSGWKGGVSHRQEGRAMNQPQRVTRDDLEKIVIANINEYGWHCVNVIEDDSHPPWSYTIGLYDTWQHPELIIVGRSRATSHEMLKTVATDIELNDPPKLTDPGGHQLLGMKCHFLEANPRYYSDYVGFALWYYRKRKFSLHQIIWPNNDGLYPWDQNASNAFKEWQPVLGDRG
jgi:hypothetical protein